METYLVVLCTYIGIHPIPWIFSAYAGLQTWKNVQNKIIRLEKTRKSDFIQLQVFPTFWLFVNDYPKKCKVDFALQHVLLS